MNDSNAQPGIRIAQVFVEEATFRHHTDPHSPMSRRRHDYGEVNLKVETRESVDHRLAEARLTVESRPDDEALYEFRVALVMVVQAAPGTGNMTPIEYAREFATPTLMAFARELIANLTMRGRFGPVWISPINLQAGAEPSTERRPRRLRTRTAGTEAKKPSKRRQKKAAKDRK
jgi:preprotein translocase subunit SecB